MKVWLLVLYPDVKSWVQCFGAGGHHSSCSYWTSGDPFLMCLEHKAPQRIDLNVCLIYHCWRQTSSNWTKVKQKHFIWTSQPVAWIRQCRWSVSVSCQEPRLLSARAELNILAFYALTLLFTCFIWFIIYCLFTDCLYAVYICITSTALWSTGCFKRAV